MRLLRRLHGPAVAAVTTLVALALAEAALRSGVLGRASTLPPPNRVDPALLVHRIDDDPRIGWSLRPGAVGRLAEVDVRVNSIGCRADEPHAGRALLLSIGDSIAFGAGVPEDQLFPTLLAARLRSAGAEIDGLACGVSGHNLSQALLRYDRDLAHLRPSAVVLNLFHDDLAPPYRMHDRGLTSTLRERFALVRLAEFAAVSITQSEDRAPWFHDAPRARDIAKAQLAAFLQRRETEGVFVVAVLHPTLGPLGDNPSGNTSQELEQLVALHKLPHLRAEDAYRAAVGRDLPSLSILPRAGDPHPNGRGQIILTEALVPLLSAPAGPFDADVPARP